ncbi:MAG: ATP-dependent DNA helicase RecG [Chloroflexi bacterium]|nr:ATP-dependent DNA helicase RecG [Chloroflexota bacterium]
MKRSIEKLQKFFKLEARRGYDNKAVMGGLACMLDSWVAEARADALPEILIQSITSRLQSYDSLSQTSRKEVLFGLWRRVQREMDGRDPVDDDRSPQKSPPEEETRKPDSAGSPPLPTAESRPREQSPAPTSRPAPASTSHPAPAPTSRPAPVSAPASAPRSAPAPEGPPAALNASITVLPRVGYRSAKILERLGIKTLGDMLYHFPRRYDDYSQLKPINRLQHGEEITVIGTVRSAHRRTLHKGRSSLTEVVISDGSGVLRVTWFNQPWIAQRLRAGTQIVISGKVDQYLGRLTINNPAWELIEQEHLHTNRIVPVYPLTARITQLWMRNSMHKVVSYWAAKVHDPLPRSVLEGADVMDLPTALQQVHFPDSQEQLKAARHRLAFDEIFLLQLGVLQQKRAWQERKARRFEVETEWLNAQLTRLPFTLTGAQQRASSDMRRDLASGHPMNRLLQGDVGSGKTVVAAMAIAIVTHSGAQAAMMAPTSILAEQHYRNLVRMLTDGKNTLMPGEIRLLIGATPEAEKREIREGLASGAIKVVIGTHALIEGPVEFADLELAVIDEQHRFGVRQRAALRSKGDNPHLLVTTATPIPRSLALTVYGDLDLSVIDEMPPGRQAVETHVLYPKERERAYRLIQRQVEAGQQAFIIYPLVEESETSEDKAAVEEQTRLQKTVFPTYKLGLLHGRLKPSEKEAVMTRFRDGEYDILVSTSVVEVGVDIPNATVMLIEGAHRFGLAQLHQFRGRVGRGLEKAYCLLIPQNADAVENERLQAMAETNDGFVLAERDLEQRGAGDFLGTRQSGYSELRMASLTDVKLIEKARRQAQAMFERDPDLTQPEHQQLVDSMERFWSEGEGDVS